MKWLSCFLTVYTKPDGPVKTGLLGGTFDPVHNGHLAVARHVQKVLGLDSIWFIPAAEPPHKPGHRDRHKIADFDHRYAMLKMAVAHDSSFMVSDIEAKLPTPSYSIDTVKILLQETSENHDYSFIIGADAFLEINTWKSYQELPHLVDFIIVFRPGSTSDMIREAIQQNYPDYAPDESEDFWRSPDAKGRFILLPMKPVPISSTEIRQEVRKGKDISAMVPPAVEAYIREHRLYVH